ncbi:abortive infection family protein, partial [Pediococcus acidilactici]
MNIGYVKKILNNAKEDLLNNDLDSVVTKSRTIIETVFIVILRKHQIDFKENGDIGHYRSLVNKTLGMKPDNRWDKNVSSLISGLNKIVDSITTMRNINSDSHGSSNRVKINEAEAELILNSAVNISVYSLRVDGRKEKIVLILRKHPTANCNSKLTSADKAHRRKGSWEFQVD